MASSDVIPQDGRPGNVKLHPYLITFVRWCVSCLWSTATIVLHRLVTADVPQITVREHPKVVPKTTKPRQASNDHLHPEPKVECVVLHTPVEPTLDVIFVHGLYGSLGNTWRQGDWRSKYKLDPTKTPLKNHPTKCDCRSNIEQQTNETNTEKQMKYQDLNEMNNTNTHNQMKYENLNQIYNSKTQKQMTYNNINEMYNSEESLNETELNESIFGSFQKILPNETTLITEQFYNNNLLNVNNYETQAKFVSELFKNSEKPTFELQKCDCVLNEVNCTCVLNEDEMKSCEVGCGCVCDLCYSYCWPKDWIKEDFPGARVISVNYTSDPYLWRPLWVKGNKRLRLHERAEQMMEQLLALGVGERPIIWVGHSKGGLFIKQIYCDAYEAYLQINETKNEQNSTIRKSDINITNNISLGDVNNINNKKDINKNIIINEFQNNIREKYFNNNFKMEQSFGCIENDGALKGFEDLNNEMNEFDETNNLMSLITQEDPGVSQRSSVWSRSAGFMFYSVPHRGSPLADIKTPITARSVELLEISKDCSLVLDLQSRWLEASRRSRPQVRSLVETCRTLMSVLWLRIVSVDSADAGIGSLYGVSVDHREICKPSSRTCLLYTELTDLITKALNKCDC